MNIESSEWAIRPAGSAGWIHIDPASPRGRRLAAASGFTLPQKESIAMSATATENPRVHLHVVPEQQDKPLLERFVDACKDALNSAIAAPKRVWSWLKRTFHLETAAAKVTAATTWVKAKAIWAGRMLGVTGLTGAGMLTISTPAGRKVLAFAAKPFVFVALQAYSRWVWVENLLTTDEVEKGEALSKFESARNWVAERMADVRIFAFGDGTRERPFGILGGFAIKVLAKVGPFVMVDSKTMLTVRGVGAALLGAKIFTLVPLLPVAALVAGILQGVVAIGTFIVAGNPLLAVAEQLTGGKAKPTKAEAKKAAETVAAIVTDVPAPAPAQNGTTKSTPRKKSYPARAGGKPSARVR